MMFTPAQESHADRHQEKTRPKTRGLFVGRQRQVDWILSHLHQRSFLILGGRGIGKTRLLQHIEQQAKLSGRFEPCFLFLDGLKEPAGFFTVLAQHCHDHRLPYRDAVHDALERRAELSLEQKLAVLIEAMRKSCPDRTVVFFLNEIDALARHSPELVAAWSALDRRSLARFVMVGYSVVLDLRKAPLHGFETYGDTFGDKALHLLPFSPAATSELIDTLLLKKRLQWAKESDRHAGHLKILGTTFGIPNKIRLACTRIRQSHGKLSTTLDPQIVSTALQDKDCDALNFIYKFEDVAYFGYRKERDKAGLKIILLALTYGYYSFEETFLKLDFASLVETTRDFTEVSFSPLEACKTVGRVVSTLSGRTAPALQWLQTCNWQEIVPLLTLTSALEPVPHTEDRYRFLRQFVPWRIAQECHWEKHRLAELIINEAVERFR